MLLNPEKQMKNAYSQTLQTSDDLLHNMCLLEPCLPLSGETLDFPSEENFVVYCLRELHIHYVMDLQRSICLISVPTKVKVY